MFRGGVGSRKTLAGLLEGEGKTVDFFQIVGTSPADTMERFAPAFLEIIGSFKFT